MTDRPAEQSTEFNTTRIKNCVNRFKAGDDAALEELLAHTSERLKCLASAMLRRFPTVKRWDETDDVLQDSLVKLVAALKAVELNNTEHYYRLSALQIRRRLKDLKRKYSGPEGIDRNHDTRKVENGDTPVDPIAVATPDQSMDPSDLTNWAEFHEEIEKLPDELQCVTDLIWYHGLSQREAAEVLGVAERTVGRRWQQARIQIVRSLGEGPVV